MAPGRQEAGSKDMLHEGVSRMTVLRSSTGFRAAAVTALALSFVLVSQPSVWTRASRLLVFVNIGEYFGAIYVQRPRHGADYVLLRGAPLTASVRIVNGDTPAQIRIRDNQSAPFSVQLVPIGSDRSVAEGKISIVPTGRNRGESPLPRTLLPSEELLWHVSVPDFEHVPSGVYRLIARMHVVDAGGSPPAFNNASVAVELRDVVSLADRVEAARVAATRAISRRDFAAADTLARRMIALYPQSAFAFILVGDAAAYHGDTVSAHPAYLKALELLRSRGDALYAAVATEHSLAESIGAIEARIRRLD